MRVLYIGNFQPRHSTETHVARALRNNDVEVVQVQDTDITDWMKVADHGWLRDQEADFVLWTRTRAEGYGEPRWEALRWKMLVSAERAGLPTVGYHLDRWWGLQRWSEILEEPFFRVNVLCTADGGHQDEWRKLGIDHWWFPPGVSEAECEPGMYRSEFASDVAFVGSWQGYHPEWDHRQQLVNWLGSTYGDRCRFWPEPGRPAVRNEDLRDLYASVKVLVGDSCLVPKVDGSPMTHYCSDRIPETLGRGGFLVHPNVPGVTSGGDAPWHGGEHLQWWELGDWEGLRFVIDAYLENDDSRNRVAAAGRAHTLAGHTYEQRMKELIRDLQGVELIGE